jgi:hypothetical protein
MKRINKYSVIKLAINAICLILAIGSSIDYSYRARIMNDLGPIQGFEVVDSIRGGPKTSCVITLEYNNKYYNVSVDEQAYDSDYKRNLHYFYDDKRDMIFEEHCLPVRVIIYFYILFIISLLLWLPKIIKQ